MTRTAIAVISRIPSAHLSSPRNQEPLCQSVLSASFVVWSPKSIQSVKNLQFATRWNWCWQTNSNLLLVIKVQKLNNGAAGFLWRRAVCAACGKAEGWLRSSPLHTRPISFNQAERQAGLSSGSLSSLSTRSASVTCTCAPFWIITWVQSLCRTAEELRRAALQHGLVCLYVMNTPTDLPSTNHFLLMHANIKPTGVLKVFWDFNFRFLQYHRRGTRLPHGLGDIISRGYLKRWVWLAAPFW